MFVRMWRQREQVMEFVWKDIDYSFSFFLTLDQHTSKLTFQRSPDTIHTFFCSSYVLLQLNPPTQFHKHRIHSHTLSHIPHHRKFKTYNGILIFKTVGPMNDPFLMTFSCKYHFHLTDPVMEDFNIKMPIYNFHL